MLFDANSDTIDSTNPFAFLGGDDAMDNDDGFDLNEEDTELLLDALTQKEQRTEEEENISDDEFILRFGEKFDDELGDRITDYDVIKDQRSATREYTSNVDTMYERFLTVTKDLDARLVRLVTNPDNHREKLPFCVLYMSGPKTTRKRDFIARLVLYFCEKLRRVDHRNVDVSKLKGQAEVNANLSTGTTLTYLKRLFRSFHHHGCQYDMSDFKQDKGGFWALIQTRFNKLHKIDDSYGRSKRAEHDPAAEAKLEKAFEGFDPYILLDPELQPGHVMKTAWEQLIMLLLILFSQHWMICGGQEVRPQFL